MRNRKIQRMVKRGEITHEEGKRMAGGAREEPISFRNSERYSDPTAFFAVRNIVNSQRKAAL